MLSSAVALLIHIVSCLGAESHWSYSHQESWPPGCQGNLQSPIPIFDEGTIPIYTNELQFSPSYYESQKANVTNTGHSLNVQIIDNTIPLTITGGGLYGEYILTAFHFHWDSEHTVNNYRYPMEAHFVHYNSKYPNFEEAVNHQDGIAVVGVFYEISVKPNQAFNALYFAMPRIAHRVGTPVTLRRTITVADFLPSSTNSFYRYFGSLTTPGCNEVVTWTLFTTPSYISEAQLLLLSIWSAEDEFLESNYRELQDVNGRDVYFVRTT